MSSKEYREFARECMRWADEAASEEDRQHFLAMAKAWVHAADWVAQPRLQRLPADHPQGRAASEMGDG